MSTVWCLEHSRAPYLMTLVFLERNADVDEVEVDEDSLSVVKVREVWYAELPELAHALHAVEPHLWED